MMELILIRYGEMTLKKANYKDFQKRINRTIMNKCKMYSNLHFTSTAHRFYIYLNGTPSNEIIDILHTIVGISSFSLCVKAEPTYEDMVAKGLMLLKDIQKTNTNIRFKVETNRSNKRFPATSLEITKKVATEILRQVENVKVDVHNPTHTLSIDLRTEGVFLYIDSIKGLGGYPSGSAGSGLLLMSGGIDSPVAGFLAIKKGVQLTAIHYASPPYTSQESVQKVIELLEQLSYFTENGTIELLIVPFTKIQERILERSNPIYTVPLMRRAMIRIAEAHATSRKCSTLITGESIGQVASQTLESLFVVNNVTTMPVIRPLVTYDKEEIIQLAKKIKTFDISIRPFEDCCTIFLAEHPVIKPMLRKIVQEEKACEMKELLLEAVGETTSIITSWEFPYRIQTDEVSTFEL